MKTRVKTKGSKQLITSRRRVLKFPLAKGKVVDEVELSTATEDHSITMFFRDKTMLHFNIDPGFTVSTDYSDLKSGDVKPIRRWKPVRSRLFRE